MTLNKNIILIFLIGVLFLVPFSNVISQNNNNKLILTWEAQNFYPSDYKGKAGASKNSPILVSATGMIGDRVVDLSSAEFEWFLGGHLLKKGVGLSEIIFNAEKTPGNKYFIRVKVAENNFNSKGSISITVSEAQSVIELPYSSNYFDEGEDIVLRGIPYFFNVNSLSDLSFFWQINGASQDIKERVININTNNRYFSAGKNLITSIISNNQQSTESARSIKTININP